MALERSHVFIGTFPRAVYLVLLTACFVKIMIYMSPYFIPSAPLPPLYKVPASGFAIKTGITDHLSDSSMPALTATHVASSILTTVSSISLTTSTNSPTSVIHEEPTTTNNSEWPFQSFKTEDFTPPEFKVSRSGNTVPGLLFLGQRGAGVKVQAPMIMTEEGALIWHGPKGATTNTNLQTINDSQYITFWQRTNPFSFGHDYGYVRVLDNSYTEISKLCPDIDIQRETDHRFECYLDMHESVLTDRGTLIATAYNVTRSDLSEIGGPTQGWLYDGMFYEIDILTSKVLFKWSALDHSDQIPLSLTKETLFSETGEPVGTKRDRPFDFFHINSVQALDDGYLISSRHMSSIFKLNMEGNIEWRFSGIDGADFSKSSDVSFAWQHHVYASNITDETIILNLFNNANHLYNEKDPHISTGLQILLDLSTREASSLRDLDDPADHRYSRAMGSWQTLQNNHVMLGYGVDSVFKEFDDHDNCIYTAQFGNATEGGSYRVFKYPNWSAKPHTLPKLSVELDEEKSESILYASWNGATPDIFDNWAVYAGDVNDDFPSITAVFDRKGFETTMRIDGVYGYYQVIARLGTLSIRNSELVAVTPPDNGKWSGTISHANS